jgi:hypothetical protein
MNSPALDIANFLEAENIETLCYVNEEPASPNDCVTVYDTGGSDPMVVDDVYSPTIQVRVRNLDSQLAYSKQYEIRDLLVAAKNQIINSTDYVSMWLQGDIISIGRDENNRYILTSNYRLMRSANV